MPLAALQRLLNFRPAKVVVQAGGFGVVVKQYGAVRRDPGDAQLPGAEPIEGRRVNAVGICIGGRVGVLYALFESKLSLPRLRYRRYEATP